MCAGGAKALPALREALRDAARLGPIGVTLRAAQQLLVTQCCGKNLLARESLLRDLERLRAELAGPNPTPVESLLVERVVCGWLHLAHLEMAVAAATDSWASSSCASNFMALNRAVDRAQRRYLEAIKALAQVRRLALPAL